MFFNCRKKQQKRRLLNQSDQLADNVGIGNNYVNTQNAIEAGRVDGIFVFSSRNHLMTKSSSQVDMRTLEKNIFAMYNGAVATTKIRMHDPILSPMDNLVIPRVELAIRSVNTSSTRNPSSVMLDSNQKDSSVKTDGLQMTASSRYNSNSKLDGIGETRDILRWGSWFVGQWEKIWPTNTHSSHKGLFWFSSLHDHHLSDYGFQEMDWRLKNTARAD